MKGNGFISIILAAFLFLFLAGCSGSKEPEPAKATEKTAAEKTAESIRDYTKKPVDKALGVRGLAEDREKAVDGAVKNQ